MGAELKFGITGPVPGEPTESLINHTKLYERNGFDTVWFPDHLVFMAKTITPEVWSVITAASIKTKKIKMGTIGDAHRIHPAIFAHRLATVDHISGGRIFSCVGYGEKMNLDPYGIKWDNPLKRVVESVKIMRALWKGEPVDFDGEFYKLSQAELRIKPLRENGIPIYVAATAQRALRVAGEYGDGWITNAMPPRLFAEKSKFVGEGLRTREQTSDQIEKCIYMFLSIAQNQDEAYKTLEPIKHALIWPELLHESGYNIEIADEYKGLQYTKIMPNDADMIRKFREMGTKYYSREIVLDFVIAGSPKDTIKRIEEYIGAGVNHFIFRDFSPDRKKSLRVLSKEIMPIFEKRNEFHNIIILLPLERINQFILPKRIKFQELGRKYKMARIKLDLPEKFEFSTEIPVRIGDINYGGHLGHDSVLSLTHEARVRFLNKFSFTEMDIDGSGLIISDVAIVYKSEAFYGEILRIEITACDFSKYGCDFVYKITEKETGREVARAKTGILFFDYKNRKVSPVPEKFKAIFPKIGAS